MRRFKIASIFACLVLSVPTASLAGEIVGLSEERLVQCAGFPADRLEMGASTFYPYSSLSEKGSLLPLGQSIITRRRTVGCEATVTVQSGVVVGVEFKKSGGLITGPTRMFAPLCELSLAQRRTIASNAPA